ncbi:MAG: N-acetylmuramic acid 6-phosphate etherase, partial [Actinomycetota bacterium]|nr:N-acetylmuramic acid 6-phosphate etherase [Actinomycetota bacterium]
MSDPAPTGASHAEDLDLLPTEQAVADLDDLDTRPTADVVGLLLASEARLPAVLDRARPQLEAAVEIVSAKLAAGGRLVYVGAGTAGRIAALDAVECRPTFGVDDETVIALLAGGPDASGVAFEAAEDDGPAGHSAVEELAIGPRDAVVGVTASGRTPYVVAALKAARMRGAATVAVCNNPDSPAAGAADFRVELLTGAEVLAGSTRLSAATAQKIAVNVISTASFIRCGRSYGAWMVGLQPTNAKLEARAQRILQEATGMSREAVATAMTAAATPDVALVML